MTLAARAVSGSPGRAVIGWLRPLVAVVAPRLLQLAPALGLVALCFLLPLGRALWDSVDGAALDFARYGEILREPLYRAVLGRSFQTGVVVTLFCLLLGYPLAYLLTTLPRRSATALAICLLVPLFTAFLIRSYGWMSLLGRNGVINTVLVALELVDAPVRLLGTRLAVYIGMVHVLTPIAVFAMYASMARIDRRLLQAAIVLGANPVQAFVRIYLPMSLAGVIAAAVLVFILAIGFFIAPVLLGSPSDTMVAQLIVSHVTTLGQPEFGYALACLLLAATLAVLALANRVVPIEQMWSLPVQRPPAGRARRMRWLAPLTWLLLRLEAAAAALLTSPPWLMGLLLRGYAVAIVGFMLAPLVIIYVLSFSASPFLVFPPPGFSLRWYAAFFGSAEWRDALLMSTRLAAIVACLATGIALAAAFALVRGGFAAKRGLFILMLSPLLVPVVIVALCLYLALSDLGLTGSFAGLVIGHLLVATPYALVILLGAVRGLDRNLEYAAATLGAAPPVVLRRVVLPALLPGLLSAWVMAFLHSFDELLVTLFVLGRQTPTLPLKMWSEIRMQFDPTISAASSSIVTIVALVIVISQWRQLKAPTAPVGSGHGGDAR